MRLPLQNAGNFFAPDKAETLANELNQDKDDDWTYVVKHDPKGTGWSRIEILDENGKFVGLL